MAFPAARDAADVGPIGRSVALPCGIEGGALNADLGYARLARLCIGQALTRQRKRAKLGSREECGWVGGAGGVRAKRTHLGSGLIVRARR